MGDRVVRCPFVPAELELPDGTVGVKLFEGLRNLSSDALYDVLNGVTLSRRKLLERAEAVAASLVSRGCRSGDVIAIYAPNSVEWVVMLAAAQRIDAVTAGIYALLSADDAAYQLQLCQPKFVYTESSLVKAALEAISKLDGGKEIQLIVGGGEYPAGCLSLAELQALDSAEARRRLEAAASERGPPRGPHDACLIVFSSGTTGPQKAVQLSHRNVLMQCLFLTHEACENPLPSGIVMTSFVLTSAYLVLLSGLIQGYCVKFFARMDFKRFLKLISDTKLEKLGVVTSVATQLAINPIVDEFELNLKFLSGGGTAFGAIEDQLRFRFPGIVCRQVYGMTEAGAFMYFPAGCKASKPLSVGVPVFNTAAKVINGNGELLGPNERGEICVKSPCVMIGYKGNEKATAETLQDGWLHTGDFGYYDVDGYFYVIDRVKEMIRHNTYLIAPTELETILLCHPAVADAAVVGVPDPTAGELPLACVVLKTDMSASGEEIAQFLAGKVDPYKQLRGGVKFVKSILKTSSGKTNRKALKMLLSQGTI